MLCGESPKKPAEKFLHAVWQNQRIKRALLRTTKGEKVRVLHPGFWNCEGGPDFKNAVVQFETEKPIQGDIEIDMSLADWQKHSHASNPQYRNVILHVVWEIPGANCGKIHSIPTLNLREYLESPLAVLEDSLGMDLGKDIPVETEGLCATVFKQWNAEKLRKFLEHAALYRLEQKAIQITARARDAGWEQALIEWLFRALGYKHNVWPFQCIGEVYPLIKPSKNGSSEIFHLEALVLGLSGLLPDDLPRVDEENDGYVRKLWDFWWRERGALSDHILPKSVWRFHGIRPANHPHRRLALGARWLNDKSFFDKLRAWFTSDERDLETALLSLLSPSEDNYWNWHFTINSKRLDSPQPLIGRNRTTDIAMNVILPWLFAISKENHDLTAEKRAISLYLGWSPGEDNSLLKLARKRLLGNKIQLTSAALQQGLTQIVKNFCENSDSLCSTCAMPYEISRNEFNQLLLEQ